jgi:predicted RNA binding protein YcfA (HicA-like mRNA interferase family)
MKGEELIKLFNKNGWILKDIKGSHYQMLNSKTGQKIPIPCKKGKDLKKGTLEGILKKAGLK